MKGELSGKRKLEMEWSIRDHDDVFCKHHFVVRLNVIVAKMPKDEGREGGASLVVF